MIDRIIVWTGWTLAAALVIGIAVHAGITRPFTQVFDADLNYLYRAFRFNSGLEQIYFDHTGFFYSLILSWWVQFGHFLGLIPEATVEGVRAHANPAAAIAEGVYFSRVFSILCALLFVGTVAIGCAKLAGDRIYGAAASVIVAAAGGTAFLSIMLRPELTSAVCVFIAYFAIVWSAGKSERTRLFAIAIAAAFGYFAILTKMQAIVPLVLLPLVAFACHPQKTPLPGNSSRIDMATVALFLAAILVFLPFAVSHYYGVTTIRDVPVPNYSWALIAYIAAAVIAYGVIHKLPAREIIRGESMVMIGLGLGFFVNYFHFDHALSGAHGLILDNLKHYSAPGDGPSLAKTSFAGMDGYSKLAGHMAEIVGLTLKSLINLKTPMAASQTVLTWLALILIIPIYRAGNRRGAALMFFLLAVSIATKGIFLVRTRVWYEPYFQFMLLMALAIGYGTLKDRWRPWCRLAAVTIPLILAVPLVQENHRYLVTGVHHTPHVSHAEFCDNQKVWAPILDQSVYIGDGCWAHYVSAIEPDEIRFPLFGKPPPARKEASR